MRKIEKRDRQMLGVLPIVARDRGCLERADERANFIFCFVSHKKFLGFEFTL
jgi:hypothetical protein